MTHCTRPIRKSRSLPGMPRPPWRSCGVISGSSAPGGDCGSRWPKRNRRWDWTFATSRSRRCVAPWIEIDFEAAERYERELRHDVMAHIHAFGDQCPSARAIIHLGATSCYVTDNTDLMLMREGLELIRDRLVLRDRSVWRNFAAAHRDLACLGFTHLQPAQPTTVGKRACLWAYDLVLDLAEVEHRLADAQGPQHQRHDRYPGQLPRAV